MPTTLFFIDIDVPVFNSLLVQDVDMYRATLTIQEGLN